MRREVYISVLMVIMLSSLPTLSASNTGLTYLESTWSSLDAEDGELIAISPDREMLASFHNDEIIIFSTSNLDIISRFNFERVVAMEFSPDGKTLAVNKGTTIQVQESVKLIDIETMSVLEQSALTDDKAKDIAWSMDSEIIAAPGYDGDVDLLRKGDLSVKNTLHSTHNVDVSCIDYRSDNEYLLTGDESGRLAIWNYDGFRQGEYRDYGRELVDCKFTPDGLDYVTVNERGEITSRNFDGFEIANTIVKGAKSVSFSQNGNRMHVAVESNEFKGLITYDYKSYEEIKRTTFFHKLYDLEFIDDEFGRLQSIFVAAGTGQVAVYLRDIVFAGTGQPGADLDGDSIPDDLDEDDDGDGIIDQWDDDIGCDAPPGTPCSRYADLTKIRNVTIDITATKVVITDRITLPSEQSSNIRNMSRISLNVDERISKGETELFASAMCANMDHDDILNSWIETIQFSNGEMSDGVVSCRVESGMELAKIGDSTTQISFSIISEINLSSQISFPLNVTLLEQPTPTDGSISWLSPSHPMSLKFTGRDIVSQEFPQWRNDGESTIQVTILAKEVKDPTFIEAIIEYSLHPVAFIFYIGALFSLGMLGIRYKNRINVDLSDDEIYEETDGDDLIDEFEEEEIITKPGKVEITPRKRTPPQKAKKEMYTTTPQTELSSKKRVVKPGSLNKDGPIMKTKRKRLVNETDTDEPPKRKVKQSQSSEVRTRKVKVHSDEQVSPTKKRKVKKIVEQDSQAVPESSAPKEIKTDQSENLEDKKDSKTIESTKTAKKRTDGKKRKPVKRKRKPKVEKIDEDKLQDDLVSDFLSDD